MNEPADNSIVEHKANKPLSMSIQEFVEFLHNPDESGKSLSDYMEEAENTFEEQSEKAWNSASYDQQLLMFYAVCSRIRQAAFTDKGSYRHTLYEVFGFKPDSYFIGMSCGLLDIMNALHRGIESAEKS